VSGFSVLSGQDELARVAAWVLEQPTSQEAQSALYRVLHAELGGRLGSWVRTRLGYDMSADAVASLLWVQVASCRELLQQLADPMETTPLRLVVRCATTNRRLDTGEPRGWLRLEAGTRGDAFANGADTIAAVGADPAGQCEGTLTPLWRVIELTCATLQKRTPPALFSEVARLVDFLADNPVQRQSYRSDELEESQELFPELSLAQIRAVDAVTTGARNKPSTSLFAAFLQDESCVIWDHPTLYRSVSTYGGRMNGLLSLDRLVRTDSKK
jgi:hypothetical protein